MGTSEFTEVLRARSLAEPNHTPGSTSFHNKQASCRLNSSLFVTLAFVSAIIGTLRWSSRGQEGSERTRSVVNKTWCGERKSYSDRSGIRSYIEISRKLPRSGGLRVQIPHHWCHYCCSRAPASRTSAKRGAARLFADAKQVLVEHTTDWTDQCNTTLSRFDTLPTLKANPSSRISSDRRVILSPAGLSLAL